jgi:hypothetical protein
MYNEKALNPVQSWPLGFSAMCCGAPPKMKRSYFQKIRYGFGFHGMSGGIISYKICHINVNQYEIANRRRANADGLQGCLVKASPTTARKHWLSLPRERGSCKMNVNSVPDSTTNNQPPNNKIQVFLTLFTVCLSLTGVVAYMVSGNMGALVALNAPLLIVIAYYFPKHGQPVEAPCLCEAEK